MYKIIIFCFFCQHLTCCLCLKHVRRYLTSFHLVARLPFGSFFFFRKMIFGCQKLQFLITFLVYTNGKKLRALKFYQIQRLYIYLVVHSDFKFLFCYAVYAATDLIDSIDHFIAKIMAGIEMTTMYTLSLGQNYPPIDQDVTFWCVIP